MKNIEKSNYSKLFRYATKKDKIFIFIGSIAAAIGGLSSPLLCLILGNLSNDFLTSSDLSMTGLQYGSYFFYIGLASFLSSYISYWFWMTVGENLGLRFRKAYFKSLIKQNIGFYDEINPNEISSKVANECFTIQQGVGEKMANFLYTLSMTIGGFAIGYAKSWQIALVLTALLPGFGIAGSIYMTLSRKIQGISTETYSKGGAIAEECLNAIRTVKALCGQTRDSKRFVDKLTEGKKKVLNLYLMGSLAFGFMQLFAIGSWALGFYYASNLIEDQTINPVTDAPYNVGDVVTVLFAILTGNGALGQVGPSFKAFASAKDAAERAFKIIDRKSEIDIEDPTGKKPEKIEGEFSFENVVFAYPMKKDKKVLHGVSFKIKKNQKTAFVGESGCGKTTSMQLIERFYDITEGSIKLDGNELKELNLYWLRSQIGYVGQEPVLFATSIKENLLLAKENATDAEIWEALKKANASEFVSNLPQKLETFVGSNGTQLSGGQKQRLAIARAILKNPPILLLDEATSALDRKNEKEIQQTLDEISTGRTTIVIAHRLSTIQNADQIIVFDKGNVAEQGTHEELINKKGKYYELQYLQLSAHQNEEKVDAKPLEQNMVDIEVKKDENSNLKPKKNEIDIETLDKHANNDIKNTKSKKSKSTLLSFMRLLREDTYLFVIGIFSNIIAGSIQPVITIFLSSAMDVLANPKSSSFRSDINTYCLYFLIFAVVGLIVQTTNGGTLIRAGENLAIRLKGKVFNKLMNMPVSWFDDSKNSPSGINTKLSVDCIKIQLQIAMNIPLIVQIISTISSGIIIAFTASWRLALCSLGYFPILLYGFYMQGKVQQGLSSNTDEAYKESSAFVTEAVLNMRTIASFGKEDKLVENFNKILKVPVDLALKKGHNSGLAFGFAQFVIYFKYAFIFLVSGVFMESDDLAYQDMFRAIFAIIFASFSIGQVIFYIGDIADAQKAGREIMDLLESKTEIDNGPSQNLKTPIRGDIEFKNIWFKYPTREKQILKGFNLKVNVNSKIALVGPSGCGKSTLIGLLLRFYDPQQGEVLVDGIDIKNYDIQHLRQSFGYVSQEPTLFNDTIEENIKYTKPTATIEEVKQAAAEANCLKFIEANEFDSNNLDPEAALKLGQGFKRQVGPKGNQISGGQKQRIAIARAILPKPNVLLLDEATSALDSENEKIVQESLDKLMRGKTSIIVAHRISTIKDADKILVFNDGIVVESGKYEELMQKEGFFYKLEKGIPV